MDDQLMASALASLSTVSFDLLFLSLSFSLLMSDQASRILLLCTFDSPLRIEEGECSSLTGL